MKCSNCQTVNPDTRKFCRECGGKLSHICPQCGYENLTEDKFCGECGHALAVSEADHHFDYSHPQTYTPKFLAEKILDTRSTIEGERKLVTVLFANVANYTTISEKLDPEEVHQVMDGCFKVLMDQIHRYEGTIDKFTGDGIMALFGAPIALEDAPQRAIRSALAIQREMTRFSASMKSEIEMPSLKMRVGINTGPVVKDLPSQERSMLLMRPSSSLRAYSGLRHWVRGRSRARKLLSRHIESLLPALEEPGLM
jgi:RNA polymerase subunit RPABC4/transcription elongation factor Spt4